MQVKQVRNTTTEASPIQYEVTIRINVLDMKEKDYEDTLVAAITHAIEGIE